MNKWCKWHQELSFFWLLVISMWSPSFLDQKTEVIFRQWTCKAGVSIRECTLCILYYICYIICMIYCYIHYIIIYVITLHHIFVIFSMHIQCMYIDIYTYIYIYTYPWTFHQPHGATECLGCVSRRYLSFSIAEDATFAMSLPILGVLVCFLVRVLSKWNSIWGSPQVNGYLMSILNRMPFTWWR